MKKVRKAVTSLLKTKAERVYPGENKVPQNKTFPYIVYELYIYKTDEASEILAVDITAWDNIRDTSRIEDLIDNLKTLDGKSKEESGTMVILYFESEDMSPQKEAENINRRLLTFSGSIF